MTREMETQLETLTFRISMLFSGLLLLLALVLPTTPVGGVRPRLKAIQALKV